MFNVETGIAGRPLVVEQAGFGAWDHVCFVAPEGVREDVVRESLERDANAVLVHGVLDTGVYLT